MLPQTGLWHRAYQDPYGVTVYQENDDGSVGVYGIHFADGTFQTTAAGAGQTVTTINISGAVNITNSGSVLVKASGGVGGITLTLPTAVGISGQCACIKKVDATAGAVTIATTGGQTIDGDANYTLANYKQFVTVQSDNANWIVIGQN